MIAGRYLQPIVTTADAQLANELASTSAAKARRISAEQLLRDLAAGRSFEVSLMGRGLSAAEVDALMSSPAVKALAAPNVIDVAASTGIRILPRDSPGEYAAEPRL